MILRQFTTRRRDCNPTLQHWLLQILIGYAAGPFVQDLLPHSPGAGGQEEGGAAVEGEGEGGPGRLVQTELSTMLVVLSAGTAAHAAPLPWRLRAQKEGGEEEEEEEEEEETEELDHDDTTAVVWVPAQLLFIASPILSSVYFPSPSFPHVA